MTRQFRLGDGALPASTNEANGAHTANGAHGTHFAHAANDHSHPVPTSGSWASSAAADPRAEAATTNGKR
jgi:hypothetical protein